MKVTCKIQETTLQGDYKDEVEGVMAKCTRCGHVTESYGTSSASVRRCLVLMREECPKGEDNYYVADDGSDED